MNNILIIGASGHAAVAMDILQRTHVVIGILDDNPSLAGQCIQGVRVLGGVATLPAVMASEQVDGMFIGIGANYVRAIVAAKLSTLAPALPFVSAIHPSACVGRGSTIGAGAILCANSVVGPRSTIGAHCIVNTGASLDHDSIMEAFSSLAPGVHTGGGVSIGRHSAVCIGANIKHGVSIGADAVIGAGATVLTNVPDLVVAYGTPARVVRSRVASDRYL